MYVKRVRHHRDVGYLPNLAGPDPHHLIDAGHIHRFSIDREGAATRHHAAHAHVQHKLAGSNRARRFGRSEEHTSELQSLMRISYAVFCLKKKKTTKLTHTYTHIQ